MRIFLDPGHGGVDCGAVGNVHLEKDLTLLWTRFIDWRIAHQEGSATQVTRDSDMFVPLSDRVKMANSGGFDPDCFVSIHCNSNDGPPAEGFEIFHFPSSSGGRELATLINDRWPHLPNRGVKTANYAVLRETKCPAVLIELGFINNPREERRLTDVSFMHDAVEAIVEGIFKFCYGRR